MEGAPQGDEEEVNQSRRGFLGKILGAGAAAAVGGYALHEVLKTNGEQKESEEQAIPGIIHPWEGKSLEELSWEDLTDEIRVNVNREVSMSRLDEVPDPSSRIAQLSEFARSELSYFFEPYERMNQKPTHDAIHEELLILRDRIHTARAEREKRRADGRAH